MQTSKIIIAAALAALSMPATAQSESGLVVEAEAEKRITKDLSLGIGGDFRTRNDFKTIDRWSLGLSLNYKLASWLKADAGYKLLNTNFREDIDYDKSGDYNHWQPSYWGLRHRLYASLTGSYKFGSGIKISLRERWQYTYRPEKTVQRWDFDDEQWEDKVRHGTAKNQLHSRFQIEYAPKDHLFAPFASIELYNSWNIEKVRYNIGTDIRLNKQNTLSLFYRFQDYSSSDDTDMHYLGIGYKFKF